MAFPHTCTRGNSVGKQWGWVVDATAIAPHCDLVDVPGHRHPQPVAALVQDMLLAFGGLAAAIALLLLSAP
ncbi:MAG: hypothetical protein IPM11_00455 [Micropruina sp.]|nr:hypothetical protein [Micropruina sp.]